MDLYSKHSLIRVAVISSLSTLGVAILIFSLIFLSPKPAEISEADPAVSEFEKLNLQTSPSIGAELQEVTTTGVETLSTDESNSIKIYEELNEAVVNITTEVVRYNWFLEPVPTEGGSGSGSIIDKRGYVLTNNHVIANASKFFINLADGSQFEAEVVGTDPESDMAVVKFNPGDRELLTISLGTSDGLKVGQKVLAIGNPFGFDRTLTTGIVSALGRPMQGQNGILIQGMIQTDASINPGNSGGPLLNSRGEMIGINTMIYSNSGGSVGIGFAIPVNTARRVVPDLLQYGQVQRGWIDVTPVQIFPGLVRVARLPVNQGILVSEVTQGGAAQRAGIRGGHRDQAVRYGRSTIYLGGDIIQTVAGKEVRTLGELYSVLETSKPGDQLRIGLMRGTQEKIEVTLTLSPRPKGFRL